MQLCRALRKKLDVNEQLQMFDKNLLWICAYNRLLTGTMSQTDPVFKFQISQYEKQKQDAFVQLEEVGIHSPSF